MSIETTMSTETTRALDSTIDASTGDPGGPVGSGDSSAALAALLPSVPRAAYLVGDEVAKGGIGRVMRARDQRLGRPVAIKELLAWNHDQERRFIREAVLTARLQHPAIVPIYEAGRWPDGKPFYAMKLVSGRTLAELIDERRTLEERLSLLPHVLTVAQAVAYAHGQHVLHRDLKPANVLVGELGETVVIDWGLAKGVSEDDMGAAHAHAVAGEGLTVQGAVMGTPAYMPPEQAAGSPVDERADIYAIGAMLYHLIAAVPPYHDTPWEKLLHAISAEPPRAIEEHAPAISDELCAIVQKAMARDPGGRYPTAKDLAEDLHRFQTGQIVRAHTYSPAALLRRFWRRHRSTLSIAASALALVTLVVIGAFVKTDQERRNALEKKREAESARRDAEDVGRRASERADEMTLLQAEGALARDPNEALAWLKTLSPSFTGAAEVRRMAADAHAHGIARVFRGHTAHVIDLQVLDGGKRLVSSGDDRTLRVWDLDTGEARVLSGHTDEAWNFAALPGGGRVVSLSKDNTVRLWDVAAGTELARIDVPGARKIAARADGTILAGPWDRPGSPWLWRPGDREVRPVAARPDEVMTSAFSSDGRWVLVQRRDGAASLIDIDTGKEVAVGRGPLARSKWMLTADGRAGVERVIGQGSSVRFELWNMETMTSRTILVKGSLPIWQVSKDGHLAALASENGIDVHDIRTGALVRRLPGNGSAVFSMSFSAGGERLVTGDYDKLVRVWDIATADCQVFRGLEGVVSRVDFVPDGRAVVAGSSAGDIRLFELQRSGSILTDHRAPSSGLAVGADGRFASIDDGGVLRISGPEGKRIAEHALGPTPGMRLFASPDMARLAGASTRAPGAVAPGEGLGGATLLLGTFDDAEPLTVEMPEKVGALAWHPGGDAVFAALEDGSVQRVDLDGTRTEMDRLPSAAVGLAVSADGAWLAAAADSGLVRLTEIATGQGRDLGLHAGHVGTLDFSRTGGLLATGSLDHTVRLWQLEDGSFRSIDASGNGVSRVAFSPDDQALCVLNENETILRRWDVASGEPLPSFTGHSGPLTGFAFSADGRRILTWSMDRSARLFDALTGKSRALAGHREAVAEAAFAAGGALVLTLGHEGTVRSWPDDLPETLPELRAWLDAATPDRIDGR